MIMPRLPTEDQAKVAFLSTILRSNTISTFVANSDELGGNTDQLFVTLDGAISLSDPGSAPADGTVAPQSGLAIDIGGEEMALDEFGNRLSGVIKAVAPEYRQIAFFRLSDPANVFAAHVTEFQKTVASSGFAMVVAEIGARAEGCGPAVEPATALVAGLADRQPFGDGDGQTSAAEASRWLTDALARPGRRNADCGNTYALVVRADAEDGKTVALSVPGALSRDLESQVYFESFEAKFLLGSGETDKVGAFLEDCVFCPNERELTDELALRRQEEMKRQLEAEIWAGIREDAMPDRLQIYLSNCQLCEFRDEAETAIAEIAARDAARAAEAADFRRFAELRDLTWLRGYATGCVACDFRDEARTLITTIEADAAYRVETASLLDALESRDRTALETWLETCATCDRRDEAEAELAALIEAETLIGPCVAAAGLPQFGGPRQLADINRSAAREACDAAVAALPANPRLKVIAARIDQADGMLEAAKAAYDEGVGADVSEAYGLSAYMRFNPPAGQGPDFEAAAALARGGAAKGDWLSKEILMLLYSRNLVAGHDQSEAALIAADAAEDGNIVGEFFLGYFKLNGIGLPVDEQGAYDSLKLAADKGYVRAKPFLAEIYERGDAISADPDKAAELLLSGLKERDSVAVARLTDQLGERPSLVIRAIQQKLQDEGVYSGRVDGLNGPGTVGAIRAYADSFRQQG
ncbi:peptidoglycan-binding domain-containing protein [Pseudooceanicola nanhaiensis]|uniref:peptidoglycan-binding domain-containing protein n=1 Tax=Pseudooceanicola nanhaiensis TaxID=375761 RepID=UPI001CD35AF4|nr:peptidoglycan-binding domain-containing protein [Pseudooceanicola nanhaiensis]MCA0921174.1 peptidoglycan-binding protein [Pseudooceanicola nanhaiensis]